MLPRRPRRVEHHELARGGEDRVDRHQPEDGVHAVVRDGGGEARGDARDDHEGESIGAPGVTVRPRAAYKYRDELGRERALRSAVAPMTARLALISDQHANARPSEPRSKTSNGSASTTSSAWATSRKAETSPRDARPSRRARLRHRARQRRRGSCSRCPRIRTSTSPSSSSSAASGRCRSWTTRTSSRSAPSRRSCGARSAASGCSSSTARHGTTRTSSLPESGEDALAPFLGRRRRAARRRAHAPAVDAAHRRRALRQSRQRRPLVRPPHRPARDPLRLAEWALVTVRDGAVAVEFRQVAVLALIVIWTATRPR